MAIMEQAPTDLTHTAHNQTNEFGRPMVNHAIIEYTPPVLGEPVASATDYEAITYRPDGSSAAALRGNDLRGLVDIVDASGHGSSANNVAAAEILSEKLGDVTSVSELNGMLLFSLAAPTLKTGTPINFIATKTIENEQTGDKQLLIGATGDAHAVFISSDGTIHQLLQSADKLAPNVAEFTLPESLDGAVVTWTGPQTEADAIDLSGESPIAGQLLTQLAGEDVPATLDVSIIGQPEFIGSKATTSPEETGVGLSVGVTEQVAETPAIGAQEADTDIPETEPPQATIPPVTQHKESRRESLARERGKAKAAADINTEASVASPILPLDDHLARTEVSVNAFAQGPSLTEDTKSDFLSELDNGTIDPDTPNILNGAMQSSDPRVQEELNALRNELGLSNNHVIQQEHPPLVEQSVEVLNQETENREDIQNQNPESVPAAPSITINVEASQDVPDTIDAIIAESNHTRKQSRIAKLLSKLRGGRQVRHELIPTEVPEVQTTLFSIDPIVEHASEDEVVAGEPEAVVSQLQSDTNNTFSEENHDVIDSSSVTVEEYGQAFENIVRASLSDVDVVVGENDNNTATNNDHNEAEPTEPEVQLPPTVMPAYEQQDRLPRREPNRGLPNLREVPAEVIDREFSAMMTESQPVIDMGSAETAEGDSLVDESLELRKLKETIERQNDRVMAAASTLGPWNGAFTSSTATTATGATGDDPDDTDDSASNA